MALIIVPADRLGFQNRVGLSGQCDETMIEAEKK
jgi:hypothetical protein